MTRLRLAVARWILKGTGWEVVEPPPVNCRVVRAVAGEPIPAGAAVAWDFNDGAMEYRVSLGMVPRHVNVPVVTDPAAYQPAEKCDLSGPAPRKE